MLVVAVEELSPLKRASVLRSHVCSAKQISSDELPAMDIHSL